MGISADSFSKLHLKGTPHPVQLNDNDTTAMVQIVML